jgi:hypothetical protein
MWSEQPLEKFMFDRLGQLPEPDQSMLLGDYLKARNDIVLYIASNIKAREPSLTEHGEDHLADVMRRVHQLVSRDPGYFTPEEIYLLAVSVLFHDAGNVHGRHEHERKIGQIYHRVRNGDPRFRSERNIVLQTTRAHRGTTNSGSADTIGALTPLNFQNESVRTRELAAVLRLADELAEGPHRTSPYMLDNDLYPPDSNIYHKYAQVASYALDFPIGRISVTYNLDLERSDMGIHVGNKVLIADILKYCYKRAAKLNQERRYCQHYCDLLGCLKSTTIVFLFYFHGEQLPLEIEPVVLNDLVVPGDEPISIEKKHPKYETSSLCEKIRRLCEDHAELRKPI